MRHASSIVLLGDGSLAGAWFAGSYEAEPDVSIYFARRSADGKWSPARRISVETGVAHWNPVLALTKSGSLILFYKLGCKIETWQTMVRVSRDFGTSWGPARELVPGDRGGRGPVRNKILLRRDGAWVAGASLEKGSSWTAFSDVSTDEGQTWKRSQDICIRTEPSSSAYSSAGMVAVSLQSVQGRGIIQPTLWEDTRGVHMLLRSTEGWVYRCDSSDGGFSWNEPYPTAIPNNNSAIDVVRLNDGSLVLAHNPVSGNWAARSPLVLSVSPDGGEHWEQTLALDSGQGEFSYPCIIASGEGLYVSWTHNRKEIPLARISLS
jgi:predicted neuraminidase